MQISGPVILFSGFRWNNQPLTPRWDAQISSHLSSTSSTHCRPGRRSLNPAPEFFLLFFNFFFPEFFLEELQRFSFLTSKPCCERSAQEAPLALSLWLQTASHHPKVSLRFQKSMAPSRAPLVRSTCCNVTSDFFCKMLRSDTVAQRKLMKCRSNLILQMHNEN